MPEKRMALGFPVVKAPPSVGGGRLVVLGAQPATASPGWVECSGITDSGHVVSCPIPLPEFVAAQRQPTMFVEMPQERNGIIVPPGAGVEPTDAKLGITKG